MFKKSEAPLKNKGAFYFFSILILFFLPAILLMGTIEALAWYTGETQPLTMIARWQDQGPGRIWRGGDGRSYISYKLARLAELAKRNEPQILVLGSSRSLAYRHEDFEPFSFYNAAECGWTFNHYIRFLTLLEKRTGRLPKVVIFNLDFSMFSEDFDKVWADRFYVTPETHWAGLKIVLDHTVKSIDWPFFPAKDRPPVFPGTPDPNIKIWNKLSDTDHLRGYAAVLTDFGFQEDGSMHFGRDIPKDPLRLVDDNIFIGVPPVEGGDVVAKNQLEAFEKFVKFAKSKNIILIGVQVPYYDKVISGFEKYKHNGVWKDIRSPERKKYFEDHGVIFFDLSDMPKYRYHPEFFLDSVHPGYRIMRDVTETIMSSPETRQDFLKAGLPDSILAVHKP
ncbi:hypothetical protein GALL_253340 [mine drainage metagenome]|uniref:Uncharacterized protein n=1 Tax=mine drainage metagenome TaxID=410659 RepID=A0A1J5RTC8_9ZZZZ